MSAASVGSASFYIVGDVFPSPTHHLNSPLTPLFYHYLPTFAKFEIYQETISFTLILTPMVYILTPVLVVSVNVAVVMWCTVKVLVLIITMLVASS